MNNASATLSRRKTISLGIAAVVIICMMICVLLSAHQNQHESFAAHPGSDVIAFERNLRSEGFTQIYIMDADGSRQTRVSYNYLGELSLFSIRLARINAVGHMLTPAFPDNPKVVFSTYFEDGITQQFYQITLDGTKQEPVPSPLHDNLNAVWAPNRHYLAWPKSLNPQGTATALAVITSNGLNERCLTCSAGLQAINIAWSPDSQRIAFVARADDDLLSIFVINVDGSGLTKLTSPEVLDDQPAWSPDGQWIAFRSTSNTNMVDLSLIRVDGTERHRLAELAGNENYPAWSPDGSQISFTSSLSLYESQIFVINADGTNLRQLTDIPNANHGHTTWIHVPD